MSTPSFRLIGRNEQLMEGRIWNPKVEWNETNTLFGQLVPLTQCQTLLNWLIAGEQASSCGQNEHQRAGYKRLFLVIYWQSTQVVITAWLSCANHGVKVWLVSMTPLAPNWLHHFIHWRPCKSSCAFWLIFVKRYYTLPLPSIYYTLPLLSRDAINWS